MDSFLTFLKILFFSSSTVLNDAPIDIGSEPIDIPLEQPLDVLTSGAHLRIDISSEIDAVNATDRLRQIRQQYPDGCVVASLQDKGGTEYSFSRSFGSVSPSSSELGVASSVRLPEDIEFIQLSVSSSKPIRGTTITWQNYKH